MGRVGRGALALMLVALSMFVIAACGGDDDSDSGGSSGGGGKQGGSITISETSQPDFLDPALTYTVNGIEPLWIVYTPLLTYKHAEGPAGTELIPGVAEALPTISKDGKTYELTLRKGLKYSDGSPVKASDWEHTPEARAQPRVGRVGVLLPDRGRPGVRQEGRRERGHPGRDDRRQDGQDHDQADRAGRLVPERAGDVVHGHRPRRHAVQEPDQGSASGRGRLQGRRSRCRTASSCSRRTSSSTCRASRRATSTRSRSRSSRTPQRQAEDVISGKLDYMQDPPPADIKPEVKAKYSRSLRGAPDLVDLLHVHEHARGSVRQEGGPRGGEHRPRQAGPRTAVRRRGGPGLLVPAAGHAGLRRGARRERTARGATRTSRRTSPRHARCSRTPARTARRSPSGATTTIPPTR